MADVNYKVAKEVTDEIRNQSDGMDVLTASVRPAAHQNNHDELTQLMVGKARIIKLRATCGVFLIAGFKVW